MRVKLPGIASQNPGVAKYLLYLILAIGLIFPSSGFGHALQRDDN